FRPSRQPASRGVEYGRLATREGLMSKMKATSWLAPIVVVGLCAVGIAAAAGVHVTQPLTPTSHAPRARGRAKLALKTVSKGHFVVVARRLDPHASFDLLVGGIKVGSFRTNLAGSWKIPP